MNDKAFRVAGTELSGQFWYLCSMNGEIIKSTDPSWAIVFETAYGACATLGSYLCAQECHPSVSLEWQLQRMTFDWETILPEDEGL